MISYFMGNELDRMWRKAIVTSFEVIFLNLPGKPPGFSFILPRFETGTSGIRSRVVTHLTTTSNSRNCATKSAANQVNPCIINTDTNYCICIRPQVFYAIINIVRKSGFLYFWACD
jgi:hypothetical protein